MRIYKFYTLSSFQIYNTILSIVVTTLYSSSPRMMQLSREMGGWEMLPGVTTGCKNIHLLYIRHRGYNDSSDRGPAPFTMVGGESEKSGWRSGRWQLSQRRTEYMQGSSEAWTHPWWDRGEDSYGKGVKPGEHRAHMGARCLLATWELHALLHEWEVPQAWEHQAAAEWKIEPWKEEHVVTSWCPSGMVSWPGCGARKRMAWQRMEREGIEGEGEAGKAQGPHPKRGKQDG